MSHFLLDTHTFIWLTENNPRLPDRLRDIIDDADLVYLSIVSLWEIAIKLKLGKLSLQRDYETIGPAIEASDILILPIVISIRFGKRLGMGSTIGWDALH